jgi:fumarate hydratase class II
MWKGLLKLLIEIGMAVITGGKRILLPITIIRNDRMPKEVYRAYGYVKNAAATVNAAEGILPKWKEVLISKVSDEIIEGKLDSEFPANWVWYTI